MLPIDTLSLEAVSLNIFEIAISDQTDFLFGDGETPPKERIMRAIDGIVAKRDEFVAVYSRSHDALHILSAPTSPRGPQNTDVFF